jgi:hypothetical protein
MPNPTPEFASVVPQVPLNAGGPFGPNLSYARFYIGTGGMPGVGVLVATGVATGSKQAGPAGWPGFGATLVGTGRYNIMHPPANIAVMLPYASSPSGRDFDVSTVRTAGGSGSFNPATGITQIQVFETPTGGSQLVNPPTGTRFDLFLYVNPNNSSGFTTF